MALLDRLRNRPRWENADPDVRVEAIKELGGDDREVLAQLAQSDTEAKVRRAALRRLDTPEAWTAALKDADESVRAQATEALLAVALRPDAAAAEAASAALGEGRHLVTLARSAAVPSVRRAALERIRDPRSFATLAKLADDPAVRMESLGRVEDPGLLLDVATKSDHKDVVMAAVDRIEATDALAAVVARARNRAASRRAKAKLDSKAPKPAVAAPAVDDDPGPEMFEDVPAEPEVEQATAPASDEPPAALATPDETIEDATPPGEGASVEAAAPAGGVDASEAPSTDAASPDAAPPPSPEAVAASDEARRKQEEERRARVAAVEALCVRLEAVGTAEKPSLKEGQAALRDGRAAQDSLAGVPGKLIQRLKAARAAAFAKVQELREADEWSRWGNAAVQEELCRRLEALVGRDDLEKVAAELHDTDQRWAEVRYAPRDQADALRQRYQAARGLLKTKVDAYFAKKGAEEAANLEQKNALCERAEALADSTDWLKAAEELKGLQARWKEIGPIPRRQSQPVWNRFRGACDRFFTRRDEDLKKRKEQWTENLARKEALCARAEELAASTDWETAAAEVRKLQADWKTIGPVKKNKSEAIWQRFRSACDGFFDRYKHRDALDRTARREQREAVVREIEALAPSEGAPAEPPPDLVQTVQDLQTRARQGATLHPDDEKELSRRFAEARGRLIAAFPGSFRGTELDPEANRARREKLCARVEALAGSGAAAPTPASLTGVDLARRLKEALAANTIGGAAEAEAKRRAEAEEVRNAQAAWTRLGPVPGDEGAALEARFSAACRRFFETHPEDKRPPRPARPQPAPRRERPGERRPR